MGGPLAWGEIAFGAQPSAPMFRAGNGALSLNSAGLAVRVRPPPRAVLGRWTGPRNAEGRI